MSLWERHKQARRRRIVDAARDLILEGGVEVLNMQSLAREAEVSVATLYNLCGSKADILYALLGENIQDLEQRFAGIESDDVVEEFRLVSETATRYFLDHADLFVPLMNAVNQSADPLRDPPIAQRIVTGLHARMERAAKKGDCLDNSDALLVAARQMYLNVNVATRQWARGVMTEEEFKAAYFYGIMSVLLVAAAGDQVGRVCALLREVEPKLVTSYPLRSAEPAPADSISAAPGETPSQD